jgi:hypothetical protein
VTIYQTFENLTVFNKFKEIALAGNEGNFDRPGEVSAGQR